MQTPLQVTFHNMPPSPALETVIRERAAKLEQYHARITSCRVVFDAPHLHKNHGKRYQVRIDIALPGGRSVVVDRDHHKDGAHAEALVAIRDAFDAAQRQIKDLTARQRSDAHAGNRTLDLNQAS